MRFAERAMNNPEKDERRFPNRLQHSNQLTRSIVISVTDNSGLSVTAPIESNSARKDASKNTELVQN
jgi:hypothetical protein